MARGNRKQLRFIEHVGHMSQRLTQRDTGLGSLQYPPHLEIPLLSIELTSSGCRE